MKTIEWEFLTAMALFFGGLGGGSFIVASITSFLTGDRFKKIKEWGGYIGVASAILCLLSFATHAGNPERAFLLYTNPSSMIWIGSVTLTCIIPLGLLYATYSFPYLAPLQKVFFWKRFGKLKLLLEILLFFLGITLVGYTSFVLGVAWANPFWNTPLLTVIFFLSGVSTALMAIGFFLSIPLLKGVTSDLVRPYVEALHRLDVADAYFVSGEILVALWYVQTMFYGKEPLAIQSAAMLVQGKYSLLFWVVFIGIGLIIPLLACILLAWKGRTKAFIKYYAPSLMFAAACVLVGGAAMRYIFLRAGQLL